MSAPKLYILHDNDTWLGPIEEQLRAIGVPFESVDLILGAGGSVLDLSSAPPPGLYFNRCSPSSHSRGKRFSLEVAANFVAWLERHGRTVINGSRAIALEGSKVLQELELRKHKIASPVTAVASGPAQLAGMVASFQQRIGPGAAFLTKHNRAGSGLGVRLFETVAQATGYIEGAEFEESVDGLTLLQSYVDCPEKCLYRLEFINARFLYAVRVDTSHVTVATRINNCPADSCQVKKREAADSFPADSQKKPRFTTASADANTEPAAPAPVAAAAAAKLVGNCPLTASAAKFQIAPEFGEKHPVLVSQLERWLRDNRCSISGIEVVFDAQGTAFVIDCNTCNTNYNRAAEAAAGMPLVGSKAIAKYLQTELSAVVQAEG